MLSDTPIPSNVTLAQVLVWSGLFNQQLYLCRDIQGLIMGEVPSYNEK